MENEISWAVATLFHESLFIVFRGQEIISLPSQGTGYGGKAEKQWATGKEERTNGRLRICLDIIMHKDSRS